jgi:hypothetical protein
MAMKREIGSPLGSGAYANVFERNLNNTFVKE